MSNHQSSLSCVFPYCLKEKNHKGKHTLMPKEPKTKPIPLTKPNIAFWCDDCHKVLDKWIVDSESSGVLSNLEFQPHRYHSILIRLVENLPKRYRR